MRRPAALFPLLLILGALVLAPAGGARADAREGPIAIDKCQTITHPGSYKLVKNLTAILNSDCLVISARFVTIDLAGFTISGTAAFPTQTTAIAAGDDTSGITVRNGSISGFSIGVDLGGEGSIVEGLRLFSDGPGRVGISAKGIVKGNVVDGFAGPDVLRGFAGIGATGIVTGNYVSGSDVGMSIGQGSTVIGNTVINFDLGGIRGSCPSNVTDNTVLSVLNRGNIVLDGDGCNSTNNAPP
jgi:hypothetical protein